MFQSLNRWQNGPSEEAARGRGRRGQQQQASGGEKLAKYTFTGEISGGFYGVSEIILTWCITISDTLYNNGMKFLLGRAK